MDAFDPATVFSSIDDGGRYAYGNQPAGRGVEPRPARRGAAAAARTTTRSRRSRWPSSRSARFRPQYGAGVVGGHARQARPARRAWPTTSSRRWSTTCSRCCSRSRVDHTSFFRGLGRGRARGRRARARACSSTWPRFDAWPAALAGAGAGRRRDGPGQPRLHPAQPPRRGGARGRRPPATSARWSRLLEAVTRPVRRRAGPRALRRAGAGRLRRATAPSAAPETHGATWHGRETSDGARSGYGEGHTTANLEENTHGSRHPVPLAARPRPRRLVRRHARQRRRAQPGGRPGRQPDRDGAVANTGWDRWTPVNAAAIGAHLVGSIGQISGQHGPPPAQQGVASMALAKTALTAAALGVTGYARVLGRQVSEETRTAGGSSGHRAGAGHAPGGGRRPAQSSGSCSGPCPRSPAPWSSSAPSRASSSAPPRCTAASLSGFLG